MSDTFAKVAIEQELDQRTSERYVAYMSGRWKNQEKQMCSDGYAVEWALRFKAGIEYQASDSNGTAVLKQIDNQEASE